MADIELNALGVKSDSIPDNWLITLVDPTSGAVAKNMTVAKFVELFTQKQPEATSSKKGLLNSTLYSKIVNNDMNIAHITGADADNYRKTGIYGIGSDIPGLPESFGVMFVLKSQHYVGQFIVSRTRLTFRLDTGAGWSSWSSIRAGANTLSYSLEKNALTETISLNNSILPPPPANCVPESSISDSYTAQFAEEVTDSPDTSIPVEEKYIWSIEKIGQAVLQLQEENKQLKQILNINNEVQQM